MSCTSFVYATLAPDIKQGRLKLTIQPDFDIMGTGKEQILNLQHISAQPGLVALYITGLCLRLVAQHSECYGSVLQVQNIYLR